ncbi:MAG: malate synthase A [Cycloclasticus sp.]|nr:MAG: malate synthase A [Cycloclasticus sp.]
MKQLTFTGEMTPEYASIYTDEANNFVATLAEEFAPRVRALLDARQVRQAETDAGKLPDFLPETKDIRDGDWNILGVPDDLQDRRVEITGPVDRKMIINALNANVKVFMADFEDSLSPTWEKVAQGQINMRDAVNGTISLEDPKSGKHYELNEDPAVLICRARGLHLPEKHIRLYDQEIPGGLIDFAYYFFHNYKALMAKSSASYFYIPKLQSHQEARWWADVMDKAEDLVDIKRGTVKATVLIETLPAVFEMDEILHEFRDHIVALNCGRWDYIFSYIKTLRNFPDRVLPDRQAVTMNKPFLSAYSRLLIKTCHKRGALAMGGMAAFIPSKDPEENAAVLKRVVDDKTLEAQNGHDGTWVAHPGLADTAMAVLDEYIGEGNANQMSVSRADDADVTAAELLEPCEGERTEEGMRANIRIAVQYLEAWIQGNGCVPIYGLMEDAATAEISRSSIWQWIHHGKELSNGKKVTVELFRQLMIEELETIKSEVGEERFNAGRFDEAAKLMDRFTTSEELVDFLTVSAYEYL